MKRACDMGLMESSAYFDKVAEEYSSWYDAESPGGYALRMRQQLVLELLDQPVGKVLDAGCGPGVLARELLNLGYEVWGVDASPRMIEQCHKHFGKADRAHFAIGDARSLPFPDGFFATVICTGVISNAGAGELAVKEMVRVVKPNGTLLISFPNLVSPYAAWRTFVFYPAVALLRPVYYRLAGRPQPPSLYNFSWRHQLRSLASFFIKPQTAHTATKLVAAQGAEVTDIVYFYFNVFPSPLDELFPRWTLRVVEKLECLRFGRLKGLGVGFLLKAKKRP